MDLEEHALGDDQGVKLDEFVVLESAVVELDDAVVVQVLLYAGHDIELSGDLEPVAFAEVLGLDVGKTVLHDYPFFGVDGHYRPCKTCESTLFFLALRSSLISCTIVIMSLIMRKIKKKVTRSTTKFR